MATNGATIVKGSMTMFDDHRARQEFMFNPSVISDSKGANWGASSVPHVSHPVYQYGAGTERVISFQLYHDGDRARALGGGRRIANDPGLDVAPSLRFWRSLLYQPSLDESPGSLSYESQMNFSLGTGVAPRKVVFNYGTFWRNVLCVVKKADITASFFSPKGEIVRATVDMVLAETPSAPVFASEVRGAFLFEI